MGLNLSMNTRMSIAAERFAPALIVTLVLLAVPFSRDAETFAQNSSTITKTLNTPATTPSEVVREFYRAMREKRFREAFAMSVYRSAVENLSAEEFEELRPDFERIAALAPEKIDVTGELISGDTAEVFVKVIEDDAERIKPHPLTRRAADGVWIFGDRASLDVVAQQGRKFFFEARIAAHEGEVKSMLPRIATAQLVYAAQHGGQFADLDGLVRAGLVPPDVLTTESTGYRFHLKLAEDKKSYTAGAEPTRYGRTGRLSFFMNQAGLTSKDTGGKPLPGKTAAKK